MTWVRAPELSDIPVLDFALSVPVAARLGDSPPTITLFPQGNALRLAVNVQLRTATSFLFEASGVSPGSCSTVGNDGQLTYSSAFRMATGNYDPSQRQTLTTIQLVTVRASEPVVVECPLSIHPIAVTFAARLFRLKKFETENPATIEPEADDVAIVNADFGSLAFEDGFKVSGGSTDGVAIPDYQRGLAKNTIVDLSWNDSGAAAWHDVTLVVVGALFGLAASCLQEWARPWIVGRGTSTDQDAG